MCGESFAFWSCVVLFITSSSKISGNITSDNKEANIWEGNIWEETYSHMKFIRSKRNNNNETHILPYEKCANITCIQLCCPFGDRLIDKNCIASENEYVFPNVYSNDMIQCGNKKVNELFPLTVQNPCQETIPFVIYSNNSFKYIEYMIFANSSLYLPYSDIFVESTSYCLAFGDYNQFNAIICLEAVNKTINKEIDMIDMIDTHMNEYTYDDNTYEQILILLLSSCRIVSMLCLLTTFVVYSILPELRNIHSFILCKCCILLFFGWMFNLICIHLMNSMDIADIPHFICLIIALLYYFCFMSWSFWLSVMSFNFWWTFRDFHSLQRNKTAKQGRKILIYSIFAWGSPSIFTIISIIMDFVPNMPEHIIRPEFCVESIGIYDDVAYVLYFYGPQSICIISSICLSICTALKIVRYEKDTARHLKDSGNRFYNDNKRWFSLYLRLFIILFIIIAINWIIITVTLFWLSDDVIWFYTTSIILVLNAVQDIATFIIFVCRKTIIRLLLKRFCQNCKCFSKTSNETVTSVCA